MLTRARPGFRFSLASVAALLLFPSTVPGQTEKPETEFSRLAAQLAQQRLGGAPESETQQEQALAILDALVLDALNAAPAPDLAALSQRLAAMVTQQPAVGEDYRVVGLGGTPAAYALAANFGLGGPSAVRIYASTAGRYALAGRVDRYAQKNFFDEYLELVPVSQTSGVFVTVTGRTDELQTGSFAAWLFDGRRLRLLWASDILPQSSFESRPEGFRLTYCAETDEDRATVCVRMSRDLWVWDGEAWKRVEQTPVPVPKH